MSNAMTALQIDRLEAWYGESQVLFGASLDVREGETVTLLGRNGAGKTTTLRSVVGLVRRSSPGQVRRWLAASAALTVTLQIVVAWPW